MEVYAAMIHEVDQNVGRLVDHLKQKGEYDDTVFIFFSDNGAESQIPENIMPGSHREWIERAFDNSLDNMGKQGSYIGYGPSWALVSQTPFRMVKGYTYEGGIRSPAFISYPGWKAGQRLDQFVHITDIAPTLLDLAGASAPSQRDGVELAQMTGHSLLPWLEGRAEVARPQDKPVCTELFGRASVWKDGWKMVHSNKPWGTGDFELFDIKVDPTEQRDLALSEPAKLAELKADWADCQERFGIHWNAGLAPQMFYSSHTEYLFQPRRAAAN